MEIPNMKLRDRIEAAKANLLLWHPDIDELKQAFVEHGLEAEFAAIGYVALDGHDRSAIPEHLFVWIGYEIATDSKYLGEGS